MELTPGTSLGHYEILGPLGAGGMGKVYRARDGRLGREVAVKILLERYASDADWLRRFEREARLLASFLHPNIAVLHGRDETEGIHFLVMELVPGQTLTERLDTGSLPLVEALEVCRQIAEALETAHEKGIVHRDLKPANVKITPEGQVKVLDFGLAVSTPVVLRSASDDQVSTQAYQRLTAEGAIIGTPAYMSPEQARGKPIDKRTDVWAFGCVLYEALTGQRPFGGETVSDVLAAVIERTPQWESLPAGVPPRITELVRRCLQKDPRQRLRDIGDARLEIETALAELARPQEPASPSMLPEAGGSQRRSARWWVGLASLIVLSFVAGIGLGPRVVSPPRPGPALVEPGPDWSNPPQQLLGGTTRVFGPRVSPDERWLAFSVLHKEQALDWALIIASAMGQAGGLQNLWQAGWAAETMIKALDCVQAQVGVMDLNSGEWWLLTRHSSRGGPLGGVCWSADSKRIFFERVADVPGGVYWVNPLDRNPQGAREMRVLDEAECPQVAADKSLIVCKLDEAGNYRLHRHWEDRRKPDQVVSPPIEFNKGWASPVRALHKRNAVVFCGKILNDRVPGPRRFYLLDLNRDRDNCRPLSDEEVVVGGTGTFVPLAVSPDDRFVYTVLPAGDAFQVVRIPVPHDNWTGKAGPPQPLLLLTTPAFGVDVDGEGRLYFDQFQRGLEVLRFDDAGGRPERVASPSLWRETGGGEQPVELPDGRVLLPSILAGRDRLLKARLGKAEPLLEDDFKEDSASPALMLDDSRLIFTAGSGKDRRLQIAKVEKHQVSIGETLDRVPGDGVRGLAASPDGKTLYYVQAREIWKAPVNKDDHWAPRKVEQGDGVAVHPDTGELLIQRFDQKGVHLYQKSGQDKPLKVKVAEGSLRPTPAGIGGRAIDMEGRVLVPVTREASFFWEVAWLDPRTGSLTRIPVEFDGDIYPANWTKDGKILAFGYPLRSELWRLTLRK